MIELRSLVEAGLRRFSCHWEVIEENLLHAAVPTDSPLRQILDVSDTAYLALVEFEEDRLAGLEPVRHLIPGSIYLERFIGTLTDDGTVGDMLLPDAYARPDGSSVRSFLMDSIQDAGDCAITRSENVVHRCVTFHFVMDLFAIEASKTLISITFDFDNKRLIANPDISRLRTARPAIVEIADTELRVAAATVLERVKAEACRQIKSYADEHSNERSSAMKRLKQLAKKQLGDVAAQPIQSEDEPRENQRDEMARDWDQRIRHSESQYRAEGAQITLVSATRQIRPFVQYEIHFPGRMKVGDAWKVLYDLTCGNFLLPECQSCGSAVERLVIGEGLCTHPLCDRCAKTAPACCHPTCKLCTRKCSSCASTMCRDCNFGCNYDGCSLSFCDKHKRLCSGCGACACSRHRQFCRSCQRSFCNRCYYNHQWKQADCGHFLACGAKRRVCRICKNALCTICSQRCEHCGRFACNTHIVECLGCRSRVCEGCAGLDCGMCGAKCCKAHAFQCKVCLHHRCYEHARWCAMCNSVLCKDDVISCRSCQSQLCPRHSQAAVADFNLKDVDVVIRCGICEKKKETLLLPCSLCQKCVPHRLLTRHGKSDGFLCIECRSKCFVCNTWLSEFEIGRCVSCGMHLCDECLDYHSGLCP